MKYKVKVLRIAYGEVEVEVDSEGKMQASIDGLQAAKEEEISTYRSEYEVVGIYPVEEKKSADPVREEEVPTKDARDDREGE